MSSKMAKYVLLPCPHETTTSYGKGTRGGPAAILRAFQQVEWFDEELEREPCRLDEISVLKPIAVSKLQARVENLLAENKFPIILGGEHSLTPFAVKAFAKRYSDLSVLHLDAHADLRDSYQGKKDSHACAIRRVLEICPAVQVGIRNISSEEWAWAKGNGQLDKIHFANKLELTAKIETQLSSQVYVTLDVDVFDPAVVPATGTPEPGGMLWYEVLEVLRSVCAAKKVVGFDIVELSPRKGDIASDFTAAKLIFKLLGYLSLQP